MPENSLFMFMEAMLRVSSGKFGYKLYQGEKSGAESDGGTDVEEHIEYTYVCHWDGQERLGVGGVLTC